MATRYRLRFRDYTRQKLPREPGIYCVYAGYRRTGRIKKLLYIGEAGNIWGRADPKSHHKGRCWSESLVVGEELFFTAARFGGSKEDRGRVEKALIYEHVPPCNDDGVDSFRYDDTTVITTGRNHLLSARFTVRRNGDEADSTKGPYGLFDWVRRK